MNKTLLAVTTCNGLETTKKCVESLQKLPLKELNIDLVFFDDYSNDGTILFLQDNKFAFTTKDKTRGLTHSWNKAYLVFKNSLENYSNLILSNNDVLVPKGAIVNMLDSLEGKRIVGPVSNRTKPEQMVTRFFDKAKEVDFKNPDMYEQMQKNVETWATKGEFVGTDKPIRTTDDIYGFFFAMNRTVIECEYKQDVLFNPGNRNIGQERPFFNRLKANGFDAVISTNSFVYHFGIGSSHHPKRVGK